MVTCDAQQVADAVTRELDIDEVLSTIVVALNAQLLRRVDLQLDTAS